MSTQRYSVTPHPIETLLTWVKSGEIATPEIQRPFVWDATKVRNLLDSLYLGYPVGYLAAWRNPNVKLKDGTSRSCKRILIYKQQRIAALMAAFRGKKVIPKDYETTRIRVSLNPQEEKFEITSLPSARTTPGWTMIRTKLATKSASTVTPTSPNRCRRWMKFGETSKPWNWKPKHR